jgi:hypothetical protein
MFLIVVYETIKRFLWSLLCVAEVVLVSSTFEQTYEHEDRKLGLQMEQEITNLQRERIGYEAGLEAKKLPLIMRCSPGNEKEAQLSSFG